MSEPAGPSPTADDRPPIPASSERASARISPGSSAPAPLAEALSRMLASLESRGESGDRSGDELLALTEELVTLARAQESLWDRERDRHARRLRLEELLPRIATTLDVREVLGELSHLIQDVLPHDVLAFALLLPDRSGVRVQAATRAGVVELPPYRFSNPEEALDAHWEQLLAYDLEPHADDSVRVRITPAEITPVRDVTIRPGAQWVRFVRQAGIRSTLRVPIRSDGRPIGGVAFMATRPDAFGEDDGFVVSRVADQLALALAHQKLAEQQRLGLRLTALDKLLPALENLRDPAEIGVAIERISSGILDHDAIGIMVAHTGGGTVSGIADGAQHTSEVSPEFLQLQIERLGPEHTLRIVDLEVTDASRFRMRQHIASGEAVTTRDIEVTEASFRSHQLLRNRSEIWAAVRQGEEIAGVLLFASRKPAFYTEADVVVARRIADRISLRLAQERIEGATRQAREASTRARQLAERVEQLQRELERFSAHRAIGQSARWKHALADATRVAATDTTVLVTGESGTGKEVIARYIHRGSQRAKGPFVALNCAALPEQLLESELFGHERGAFTGALESRAGRIEQAQGGVLFLDEVGEMSPTVQAKFLRVLQEREFQRVGGSKVIKADVRIVAATNRDPRAAIAAGQFREDLYYRLGVFEIHLPPLRERPEDILLLAQAFLEEVGESIGQPSAGISEDARDQLLAHAWPGNVRELRNAIERAVILCGGGLVTREHLPITVARPVEERVAVAAPGTGEFPPEGVPLEAVERRLLEQAMERAGGNKSQAAKLLGVTRGQLYSLLRRHGLTDARR